MEKSDYPEEAIKEALLNAIVHRDYSFSGSIIINVTDTEMEFISIGGLLPGLSPDDIKSGISQPRNNKLAEVFYRLHLIESYGTGIRRIYDNYKNCSEQPRIEITSNTFKVILPNMNSIEQDKPGGEIKPQVTEQVKKVIDYVKKNGSVTETEIGELLDVKSTHSYAIARKMCILGLLVSQGRGKNKKYFLNM